MAKRPNIPCAAGCGKLLWPGRTTLPVGVATCRDCRRAQRARVADKPPATRRCTVCGVTVLNPAQKCNQHKGLRRRTCRWCGTTYVGTRGTTSCSDHCRQQARDQAPVLRSAAMRDRRSRRRASTV